jgi:tetratricopeptide (TPR) repeat protein
MEEIELWESREREFVGLAEAPTAENKARRKELITLITQRFPGSLRARRLSLLDVEADGLNASAFKGYQELGPTDAFARRRIVTMYRRLGEPEKAAEELVKYLELFQADTSAWAELRDLYAAQRELKKALFASEEVLLANPKDEKELCRHGELLLASGDAVSARKYYCLAAEVNVANEEALRGIQSCLDVDSRGCEKLQQWLRDRKVK